MTKEQFKQMLAQAFGIPEDSIQEIPGMDGLLLGLQGGKPNGQPVRGIATNFKGFEEAGLPDPTRYA